MPQAKLVAFDRRNNPQSRFNVSGLPKTTQLISKTEFELQIKKLAKTVSLPVDRALDISFKHPHEFNTEDVSSALFHKQLWDSLHEQREQQKDSLLSEIEAKKVEQEKVHTLKSLVSLFLETVEGEVSHHWLRNLTYNLQHFLEFFGDIPVSDFSGDLTAYRNSFKKSVKRNTLILRIASIKSFTRHDSVRKHFVGVDFNWGNCSKEKSSKQPFSDQDLEKVLSHFSRNKNYVRFYMFALYAGFRCEEICNIELKHLKLEGDDTKPEPYVLIPKQKNKKKNQKYTLLPQLVDFLKEDLSKRSSREKYYLDNAFGRPQFSNSGNASKQISKLIKDAGCEGTAHTFRHTFANKLLFKTRDVYLVSKALRHSELKVTEEYLSDEIQELGISERLSKITF